MKGRNMGSLKIGMVAAALAVGAVAVPNQARAVTITGTGTWSGAPFGNPTIITGTFTWDPANFIQDVGGPAGHEYWYSPADIICLGLSVSGSPVPSDNGTYSLSAYDIFLVDSSNADPSAALTSPGLEMMLLPNGTNPA